MSENLTNLMLETAKNTLVYVEIVLAETCSQSFTPHKRGSHSLPFFAEPHQIEQCDGVLVKEKNYNRTMDDN